MKRLLWAGVLLLAMPLGASAQGLLIPSDRSIVPLAMTHHRVNVALEDQVAVTKIEQTFRNHTNRALEATYLFPLPRGAGVREFSMWIGGKKVKGELLEAAKARQIYTDIVRRTQDPGLLEYIGSNLLQLRVFPVPANGEQKIELSYTAIANKDAELVEYVYPVKTDGKMNRTLEDFTMTMTIKSQHPILNIYSPTHAVSVQQKGDREAVVGFEKNQALLDKDFQLFYTLGNRDVGLTPLVHRTNSAADGYFLFLLSPRAELGQESHVPRDIVFVLDTSGSMADSGKIKQAQKALQHCIQRLSAKDRFAIVNFSTGVSRFETGMMPVSDDKIKEARDWVGKLEATGGTAINDALMNALDMQTKEEARTFTVVFFTDGLPTVGETNMTKILANVKSKIMPNTRIFTFGVGNDVNAAMLDQLAEQTRAVSTYVRPEEDIEVKVSSFYAKISHPVLTQLKLTAGQGIRLAEMYPAELPDLFHGGQIVVAGRYHGTGHTVLTLSGRIGADKRDFVYELDFPAQAEGKSFVEDLWARRKVGYILEQIRLNGEKKELVDEVTALAKRYGIATPYTSYLVVPDAVMPVAERGRHQLRFINKPADLPALAPAAIGEKQDTVLNFVKKNNRPDSLTKSRERIEDMKPQKDEGINRRFQAEANEQRKSLSVAKEALLRNDLFAVQNQKLGVDLSVCMNCLKDQRCLQQSALRRVANRNCLEVGGVWIDEGYDAKQKTVTVKAQSDAYFRILERQPQVREVFQLGNHLVWVTPNQTALVIDTQEGKDQLADEEIDALFAAKR